MVFEEGLMIREVNVFGDGTETKATVGVMACSPLGDAAKATFKGFTLKEGL
jgi:regulation of enolase protein 1 (concanavalin A-like superfamily)